MAELNRRLSNVMTGPRARFLVGGQYIGWAFGVSWGEEIAYESVDVLDRYEPFEFAPTAYRVSLNARYFRVPGQSLRMGVDGRPGIFPRGGIDPNELRRNILNTLEMEAVVIDPHTNITIARFTGVKSSGRNVDIGPRGLVGENVTFVAMYHRDEGDPMA